MSEMKNLLQHVSIINKKYDDLAELSGENFNVFDILNLNSDEVKHSLFISNLLNAKGKHGQKDLFLKLFINQILNRFENQDKEYVLKSFKTNTSNSVTEKSIGNKSEDVSNGGRIDIIINDGQHNIIIENKIYASDQEKQLFRYYNFDKKAPLIYLTLGDEKPTDYSIRHEDNILQPNHDFISISYKDDIKLWLIECIKSIYDKPFIRETLSQYLNLINELTNQSNNHKMNNEIIEILISNKDYFESAVLINQNLENAKKTIYKEFGKSLLGLLKTKIPNAVFELKENFGLKYQEISIKTTPDSKRFLKLSFLANYSDAFIEIHPGGNGDIIESKNELIKIKLQSELSFIRDLTNVKVENTDNWQGEWVCTYNLLNNNFKEIIENKEQILNRVSKDLIDIYTVYQKIN